MLSVEDAPVLSVPVMAPENWMQDGGAIAAARPAVPPVAEAPAPPPPPRFMSEDEEPEPARPTPRVKAIPAFDESCPEPEMEPELVGAVARPKFAEIAEEPARTPLPRDYASDGGNGVQTEQTVPQAVGALFSEAGQDTERDLDVPAFMRRLQF